MRAVNLLTPELRSAQKGSGASRPSAMETPGGLGAFIVLGALALFVAGVAGYVLATNVVKERKAGLAAGQRKNDATVKRAAELKPYADFQTLAQERASTVQALASARFDWEQSLRDLSRALPSNVYLSSLKGTVGGGGAGGSGIRSAIGSPAIELSGCTKSQPAVATLMSRLRNVQGVTRVSLSKSEKAAAAAGGGADDRRAVRQGLAAELRGRRLLREGRRRRRARHGDRCGRHARRPAQPHRRPTPPARAPTTRPPRPLPPPPPPEADPVTRRNSMLLVAVAAVAAVGAYWMLVLSPKREEAVALDTQITAKQAALATAEAEVATYEQARKHYKANYSMVARLGKAVPADDDVRSLLVQVNAAAKRSRGRLPHDQHRRRGRADRRPRRRAGGSRDDAASGRVDGRHRRLLDDAVLVRLQGQLLRAGQVLQPHRPVRRGPQGRARRDRAAAAAQQHHAHAGRGEGLPDAERRRDREHLPAAAHRGPDRRRDRRGPDRRRCRGTRAPGAQLPPPPPRPQRSLEPPDERDQRHLALPRAAPAVAGGDPPGRRGRRRADAAGRGAARRRRPIRPWP